MYLSFKILCMILLVLADDIFPLRLPEELKRFRRDTPSKPLWRLAKEGTINQRKINEYVGVVDAERDKLGRTALIWAARNGINLSVESLIRRGADVNARDKHLNTALLLATQYGHKQIVQLLIQKGAEFEVYDADNDTPLILAARFGHKDIAELLIQKGVDINAAGNNRFTALIWAARNGHKEVVQLLIQMEVEVDGKDDEYHHTPLMWAARNGHKEIVELLIQRGATDKNTTALKLAEEHGHKDIVELLVENAANHTVVTTRPTLSVPSGNRVSEEEEACDMHSRTLSDRTPVGEAVQLGDYC